MGRLLTARQAAVRMMDMRAASRQPHQHITAHTIRAWIRTGRLEAQRSDGVNWLVDEDALERLKPPHQGRRPMLADEDWKGIRREIVKLGRSPTLVARAHYVDPVTIYRYLRRDGLKPPYKTFVARSEWPAIIREIRAGTPLAKVAREHRYAAKVVSQGLKAKGLDSRTARVNRLNVVVPNGKVAERERSGESGDQAEMAASA